MTDNNVDWKFIKTQISRGRCTPIISNKVVNAAVFGYDRMIQEWAQEIGYPLVDSTDLSKVAQYISVTERNPTLAKTSYLDFLKQGLLSLARAEPDANQHYLDRVEDELSSLTFSQLAAERLRYPDFRKEPKNPLTILAKLDIPIYLTSSHHRFMEAALTAVGKTPRTEVYSWRQGMEDIIPPEFGIDLDYEPSVYAPLVFHAHGIDDEPASLVLTEDDHLQFLVNVIRDLPKTEVIPKTVRKALSSHLLILMGYDLHNWELRVVLQGLIRDKPRASVTRSTAVQLIVGHADEIRDTDRYQEYMKMYFDQAQFNIYWGQPRNFMEDLFAEWEKT
jgi:hypothetical protein